LFRLLLPWLSRWWNPDFRGRWTFFEKIRFPEPTLLDRDMLDGPSALKALFLLCSLPSFHRSGRF
jgi:hypothetical protein